MLQPVRCHALVHGWITAALVVIGTTALCAADEAILRIQVRGDGREPLPCRVHLADSAGKPVRAKALPFWHDHFVCDGDVSLTVEAGEYRYSIERGPEYQRASGTVVLESQQTKSLEITLPRIVSLRDLGWYSGDLHVHRPLQDMERLMRAEDLDFAPVITWWNDRNLWSNASLPDRLVRQFDGHRFLSVMAGEDEREGGALLYFGLPRPLPLAGSGREIPSPMQFVREARAQQADVWIDIEKPFWWDVPVWLALAQPNSIGIANNHMCRSTMLANEAWGRPRDTTRLPDPHGNGIWSQQIYYQILNAGLQLTPSAGSASGVLPNPVGYNRVYVEMDEPLSRDAWFRGLAAGRCFVTNGPLLIVRALGQLPGASFSYPEQATVRFDITLISLDHVSQLEIIHNGHVVRTVECAEQPQQQFNVEVQVESPGWFLVRAVTDVEPTYRFASTAPWWLLNQGKLPIRTDAAQFFLNWVDQRMQRVQANTEGQAGAADVLQWHQQAREFWMDRLQQAQATP